MSKRKEALWVDVAMFLSYKSSGWKVQAGSDDRSQAQTTFLPQTEGVASQREQYATDGMEKELERQARAR
ncbi:hypothetical protein AAY473_038230, partial [Plecturocebus cupreus]